MPIIDKNYFFDEFQIGGLDTAPVQEKLNAAIDTYEPIYLEAVLGKSLYAAYKADPVNTRFSALLDLLRQAPSPIAAYVFFEFQDMRSLQATSGVDAKMRFENSNASINTFRRSKAWNLMVKSNFNILDYLKASNDTLPEFTAKEVDSSYFWKTNDMGI